MQKFSGAGGSEGMVNGQRVSVCGDENILELVSRDGCSTPHTNVISLNYAPEYGQNGKFYVTYI